MEPNYAFAQSMAKKVLKDYKLSEVPTDLSVIFKNLGLKYIELNDADDIDGAIMEIKGKPAIAVLNKSRPLQRQRFTLAHELGHIFLKHTIRDVYDSEEIRDNSDKLIDNAKPPQETEADTFASELLVPYEQLKKYTADMSNIDKLAGTFLVSRQAITLAVMNFWKHGGKKKTKS
ncbi:MAG: ImmA/IrrE family metallo-endopeptidase [Pseudomonadota bacterium]